MRRNLIQLVAAVGLACSGEPTGDPADAGGVEESGPDASSGCFVVDAGCPQRAPDGGRWNSCFGASDCQNAWCKGLSSCDKAPGRYVVVRKSARNLAHCEGPNLIENFEIGLGFDPVNDKEREGDGRTPEGVFYNAQMVPNSSYYKAFVVSYPGPDDAERGLKAGIISQGEHDQILSAYDRCELPPQTTGLGSWIELHGMGGTRDWTLGCVAMSNPQVDKLWNELTVGKTIVILH